jgi:L-amino acid N-acyltransferase YncA
VLPSWPASHDDLGGGWEGGQAAGVDLVPAGGAGVLHGHEPHLGEHLEVVGDRGLADADPPDDVSDGHGRIAGGKEAEDLDAGGVGQAAEPAGVVLGDWPAVRAIYEAGIATGNATFETTAPQWSAWDAAHLAGHRLVARLDGRVVGWAALAPVSDRCAYAGVAEDTIYVAPEAQGRGVGRPLLAAVVVSAERGGIWTVQTGIFPENQASVRLHEACGFRVVGVRERLGRLHGRWRDVLLLERRSPAIA